jgi:glutathione-regulated potassium-efflux system ancillary protein KefC/glutathione-regulated potassium-efflux system protein KefB
LAFAILLFQDLIAIPLLAAIPARRSSDNDPSWQAVTKAIGAGIALVVLGGRFVLRHLFRAVARTGMPEVFTASALLVVLGTAWFMQEAGLSSLGRFLAGVLLADSEFRHELESQIEPFQGLLLGLFFIAVGMGIDLTRVIAELGLIAAGVATLLVVKFSCCSASAVWAALSPRSAFMLGSVLWLGGEFAFVVLNEGLRYRLIGPANHDRLVATVGLSMALTPLLLILVSRWLGTAPAKEKAKPNAQEYDDIAAQQPQVLIAGIPARSSRACSPRSTSRSWRWNTARNGGTLRRFGNIIYYGDPTRPDLSRDGGANIRLFVVAMDDPDTNIKARRLIRRMYPQAKVLARARNRQHAWRPMT